MIKFDKEFFNIEDTLECGQIFRFQKYNGGYLVTSTSKVCFLKYEKDKVLIDSSDDEYFSKFFDLDTDYSKIYNSALSYNIPYLTISAENGKGVRILRQDFVEMIFSFLISQNNNIPRIKRTIEGLCEKFGQSFNAFGKTLFAFPTVEKIANLSIEELKALGLGYRANYFFDSSKKLLNQDFILEMKNGNNSTLRQNLLSLKGVGQKVCDCIMLFGCHRTDRFPTDTWIEKLYHDNFNGNLSDRNKISEYFVELFGDMSGYFQQYLFHYKRNFESK